MTATFARRLWAVRQALFPSFEAKAYHLQFRHGALITMMLMCASFTLPANPQLKEFALSDYFSIPSINTVDSYNQIRKPIFGVMYYNITVAAFIALHLVIEPQFQRGAPVWFELFWMSAFTIGEIVCLAVFASINPSVCNFHFGIDTTQTFNMKFSPKNSATSICSNWRGMTGLLAAIIGVFLLHITWHVVVSIRHLGARRGVFVLPITDYRWTLPKQLERVNQTFPADIEASPQSDQDKLAIDTQDYTFKSSGFGTSTDRSATVGETLSFPVTTESADYNNYGRPAAKQSSMDALPAKPTQAVVLERSTHSDTESLGESSPTERPAEAPFSNYGRRI